MASADDTVAVWTARTALARGQELTAADVVPVRLRFAEEADADRYVAASDDLPDGLLLARDVGAGELLPRAALGGDATEALVEVPLSVGPAGIPSSVGVGSHVDVWVAPSAGGGTGGGTGGGRTADAVRVLTDVAVVDDGSTAAATTGFGGEARPVVVGVPPAAEGDLPSVLTRVTSGTVVLVRRQG